MQWFYYRQHIKKNKNSVTVYGGRSIELHNEICKNTIKEYDSYIERFKHRIESAYYGGTNPEKEKQYDIEELSKLLYMRNVVEKEMINNREDLRNYFQKEYEEQFPQDKLL